MVHNYIKLIIQCVCLDLSKRIYFVNLKISYLLTIPETHNEISFYWGEKLRKQTYNKKYLLDLSLESKEYCGPKKSLNNVANVSD